MLCDSSVLLHVSVTCSVFIAENYSIICNLYSCLIVCLLIQWRTFAYSLERLWIELICTFVCRCLCKHTFSFFWDNYLMNGIVRSYRMCMFNLQKIATLFYRLAVLFYIPTSQIKVLVALLPCQHLVLSSFGFRPMCFVEPHFGWSLHFIHC